MPSTPIVTECRLQLEPVGPDPFIADLTRIAPDTRPPAREPQLAGASPRRIVD